MKKLLMIILLFPGISFAQDATENSKLPNKWTAMLNSTYSTLLGADAGSGVIGNYASLDPVNANFSFRGTIGFGQPKKQQTSFLSIVATGDLVSGNFTSIFKDTKLGTNAGIQLEYNFRFSESSSGFGSIDKKFLLDDALISKATTMAKTEYEREIAKSKDKVSFTQQTKNETQNLIEINERIIKTNRGKIESLKDTNSDKDVQAYIIEIQKSQAEVEKLKKSLLVLDFQIDSLMLLDASRTELISYFNSQRDKLDSDKRVKLQQNYRFADFDFLWMTIIAGAGNKDYYTFDKSKPFGMQLMNPSLATFNIGISFNYYHQDNFARNAWHINLSLLRGKDNNISSFGTTDVSQETVFKNSMADSTRKVTKKYAAYNEPDKIVTDQQWNSNLNIYYIFGSGKMALHLFPSFYKPDDKTGFLNAGLGYMVSFKDEKKDKPNLNLEFFFMLRDTFDSIQTKTHVVDRNQFGLRATLPFNRLFN